MSSAALPSTFAYPTWSMCRTSWCRRCSRRRSSAVNNAHIYPITGTRVPKYRASAAGRDLFSTFASPGHPGWRRGGGPLSGLGVPPPFRARGPVIAACCGGYLRPYQHSNGDRQFQTFATRWLGGWRTSLIVKLDTVLTLRVRQAVPGGHTATVDALCEGKSPRTIHIHLPQSARQPRLRPHR
jgi:hypothetical protein